MEGQNEIAKQFFAHEMEHQPTKEYYHALKSLIFDSRMFSKNDMNVLEIGCGAISSHVFMEEGIGVATLTSIDPGNLKAAQDQIKSLGRMDDWIPKKGRSEDILSDFEDKQFDLVFIDGDHGYEAVKFDIEQAWRLLKRPGALILHDILHVNNLSGKYGVYRALSEFLVEYKREAMIYGSCNVGLAYIEKL